MYCFFNKSTLHPSYFNLHPFSKKFTCLAVPPKPSFSCRGCPLSDNQNSITANYLVNCFFAARLAENAWRLALVFHAIQHPHDGASRALTDDTAAAAETVARWFFAETIALLSPIRSQQNAARMDKLATIFHNKETDSLPVWRLEQKHGFKDSELRTLATEYPHRLRIVDGNPGPRGGRPSTTAQLLRINR